jgi:hypothetical protein
MSGTMLKGIYGHSDIWSSEVFIVRLESPLLIVSGETTSKIVASRGITGGISVHFRGAVTCVLRYLQNSYNL